MIEALLLAASAEAPPAGGAATGEIAIATVSATVLTAALIWLGDGHRRGTNRVLGRLAAHAERMSGQPGWAAFPAALAGASLLIAALGMYWDIALHIDVGRDEGPLANPAHYLILIGLYGIFTAGFVAMVLPKGRPSTCAVRIGRGDWYAPLGGVLICACGAFALLGFPLDDVWHRLFGQDVTLWGPTHLMLIGGASMSLASISPGPLARMCMTTSSIGSTSSTSRTATSLMLSMISVLSSTTPAIVENSCSTPLMRTSVTAAPVICARLMRLKAFPRVCPNPRSRGSIANLPYLSSR